jgi:hypothetical protein
VYVENLDLSDHRASQPSRLSDDSTTNYSPDGPSGHDTLGGFSPAGPFAHRFRICET